MSRLSIVFGPFVLALIGCAASHETDAACGATCADAGADGECGPFDAGVGGWDSSYLDAGTRVCREGTWCEGLGFGNDACCPGQDCNGGVCNNCEPLGSVLVGRSCCPGLEQHHRAGAADVCGLPCTMAPVDGGFGAACHVACGSTQYWRCDAVLGDLCD